MKSLSTFSSFFLAVLIIIFLSFSAELTLQNGLRTVEANGDTRPLSFTFGRSTEPFYLRPPTGVFVAPTIMYAKPWTVANECPLETQACVPCTSGSDCRYEPKKTHGFRGWACQNNNPGNIRNASTNMATDTKNLMIQRNGGTPACGVRYDSRGGSYFVFRTYDVGFGALKAYIKGINNGEHSAYAGTGWKCGNCTLTQFFSKYAPGDSNYASVVATEIGETSSQKLSYIVTNKLDAFAAAIQHHEGFITQSPK